jgi:hypothetical protein
MTMGDHRGSAAFGYILEALIVIGLVGTFFVYGNSATVHGPASEPAEIAKLTPAR